MTAVLEIKDLHVEVGGAEILKGVNLTLRQGEVHALMGPNGSGKSTTAYAIAGHPHYEVHMVLDQKDRRLQFIADGSDQSAERLDLLVIETAGRFIEQQ